MKRLFYISLISLYSILNTQYSFAQNFDSLYYTLIEVQKKDTAKISGLEKLANYCIDAGEFEKCISYCKNGIILSQTNNKLKDKAYFCHLRGVAYFNLGEFNQALNSYQQALMIREEIGDSLGIAKTLANIGNVYTEVSDYSKALDMELRSVSICEKIKNEATLKNIFNSLGDIYSYTGDYTKSLEYHNKSLKIEEKLNNKEGIAQSLGNIGKVYVALKNYEKAIFCQENSLSMAKMVGDKKAMSTALGALGGIYQIQKEYDKALKFFLESKKICEEGEDPSGILNAQLNMASLYLTTNKLQEAEKISFECVKLSKELGMPDNEKTAYENLKDVYDKQNKPVLAYDVFKKFIFLKDSINSETNVKALAKHEMSFEFEKKETLMKADEEKRAAVAATESKRQKAIIYGISFGLLLVLILIVVVFRNLKQSRNQNKIIEIQKAKVEQHQKEIVDSITYAKRLQQAILPARDEIEKYLPESFLFYNPKDIVAGDFYWMHTDDKHVYIAAADCTGHGVPGAMVSVVCSNALNRAVKEFALTETGQILDKVRELVIETFEKSDKEVKDGMDISLLRIKNAELRMQNGKGIEVQWSGAYNSLWYFQNKVLSEIKANKQPIGKYSSQVPFANHSLTVLPNSTFYLFSDGYSDQFGENDKKFMSKKFKESLFSIQDLPMHEQGIRVEKQHIDWKGNTEQTDDVLVIGIKV